MKEQISNQLFEMSQDDVRDWLYSDIDDLIDMEYDTQPRKEDEGK